MAFPNVLIDASQTAFQYRKIVLNHICMNVSADVLKELMGHADLKATMT